MAQIVVTNVSSAPVYISDFYTTVAVGKSVTTTRAPSDLPRMASLQSAIAAGTVTVAVTLSTNEVSSGLAEAPQVVQAADIAPGAASGFVADATLRIPIPAGVGGSADDIVVYALNAIPLPKFRVINAIAYWSAGTGAGEYVQVRTASAGGGTLVTRVPATGTGQATVDPSITATVDVVNGPSVGLFVRRSTNIIGGELFLTVRPET
jgi:hypothetical protein